MQQIQLVSAPSVAILSQSVSSNHLSAVQSQSPAPTGKLEKSIFEEGSFARDCTLPSANSERVMCGLLPNDHDLTTDGGFTHKIKTRVKHLTSSCDKQIG